MARMNLEKLSKSELDALEGQIAAAKAARAKSDIQDVRDAVYALLEKHGYSFGEVFGKGGTGRKTGPVKPKYRNPKNAAETWTGRGRRPKWLDAEMKKGKKIEAFLIK